MAGKEIRIYRVLTCDYNHNSSNSNYYCLPEANYHMKVRIKDTYTSQTLMIKPEGFQPLLASISLRPANRKAIAERVFIRNIPEVKTFIMEGAPRNLGLNYRISRILGRQYGEFWPSWRIRMTQNYFRGDHCLMDQSRSPCKACLTHARRQ